MTLLPFALLLVAVLGLWIHVRVWLGALVLAIIAAYFTGAVQGYAWLWIAVLALTALAYRERITNPGYGFPLIGSWQPLSGLLFCGLALFLVLAPPASFPRTVVVEGAVLSPGALPWTLGLGFPKVVAGIFIIGILHLERVVSWRELLDVLKRAAPVFLVTATAVMICALALGYVRFDPKWTPLFFAWAAANLFFTCLAEEAFFRGFLQRELGALGSNRRRAAIIAILVTSVLFGLAHVGGGWKFALAATIAGIGYGYAYHITQRLEAAIAVHFGLNATHFLLFTYPALER